MNGSVSGSAVAIQGLIRLCSVCVFVLGIHSCFTS